MSKLANCPVILQLNYKLNYKLWSASRNLQVAVHRTCATGRDPQVVVHNVRTVRRCAEVGCVMAMKANSIARFKTLKITPIIV